MKSVLNKTLAVVLAGLVVPAFAAESVIVSHTSGWKSVPITVDTSANTYTISNNATIPSDNYYYSYSGYRCFRDRQTYVTDVNPVTFNATITNGPSIYCYPE